MLHVFRRRWQEKKEAVLLRMGIQQVGNIDHPRCGHVKLIPLGFVSVRNSTCKVYYLLLCNKFGVLKE